MSEPVQPDVNVPPEPAPEPAPEPGEPEPSPEPEPEPGEPTEPQEPEPEPSSEAVMEEIGKKLDALTKTVATRISSILGDQATEFEVCDLCSYWNTPGWRHSGPLPQDLTEELLRLLNMRAPTELKPDPHSKICPTCDGEGFVSTGSRAVGQDQLPCVECKSMGWLPTDNARIQGSLPLANGPTAAALGVTPADAAMSPTPAVEPPEVKALRDAGYLVVAPIAAGV